MTKVMTSSRFPKEQKIKAYQVIFRSRYYPFEGDRRSKVIYATSKKIVRDNWHGIANTDEYKIVRIEEV